MEAWKADFGSVLGCSDYVSRKTGSQDLGQLTAALLWVLFRMGAHLKNHVVERCFCKEMPSRFSLRNKTFRFFLSHFCFK